MDLKRRTFLGFLGSLGLIGCTDESSDSGDVTDDFQQPETPRYGYGGTAVESTPTPDSTDRISTPAIEQRIDVETNPGDESGPAETPTPAQDPAESVSTPSTSESGAGEPNPDTGSADADTDAPTETTAADTGGGSGGQPPAADSGDTGSESDTDALEGYDVTVYVTDETGTAITADVALDGTTRAAEDGAVTFETVTAGDHRIEASADGYRDESRTLPVDSDTETTLSLSETDVGQEWCAAGNEEYATQGYGEYGYGGVVPCT